MDKNLLKEKLKNRAQINGTHLSMPVPEHAEIMGLAGFDFIWIDTEHAPIEGRVLLECINLVKMTGTASVIRVPVNDYNRTKKVLEMGPDGIIFPMISTKEQAEAAVRSTLYPPFGTRGFGPLRAVRYGNEDINEYIRYGVFDMARFVQIETAEAVRNLRDIMSVEYIDGFIIGPCDLSASVGELGQDEQPLTVSLIEQICNTLASAGRSFGVSLGDPPDKLLDFYLNLGANIISAGADFSYLLDGAKRMKSKVNAAVSRNDLS